MSGKKGLEKGLRVVRPLVSKEYSEVHRRVLGLYRAFYRYIPYLVRQYDIEKSEEDCRYKLREKFYKNACVTDIRVIDLLVIKGYMELKEITHNWQQKSRVAAYWEPGREYKPQHFIGKFLLGMD